MSSNTENLGAQPPHLECADVPYQQGAITGEDTLDPLTLKFINALDRLRHEDEALAEITRASLDPTELSVIALGRKVRKQLSATPITEGLAQDVFHS